MVHSVGRPTVAWVNTKVNPADDVSRCVRLRTPKPSLGWAVPSFFLFEIDQDGDLVQYSLGERGVLDFGSDYRDAWG